MGISIIGGVKLPQGKFTVATPSLGPTDPDFNSVVLLSHMDGSNESTTFTDDSNTSHTLTANGGAQISTATSQFGGASGLFGIPDFVTLPSSTDFDFGSGEFTFEFWIKTTTSNYAGIIDRSNGGAASNSAFHVGIHWAGVNSWGIWLTDSTSWNNIHTIIDATFFNGSWHHIAITRTSSFTRLFRDGTLLDTQAISPSFALPFSTRQITLGRQDLGDNYFEGNLDDVRVTKGVARYTANFDVPSEAFPNS